jgi:ADP-heptose:LPS heptosyltransferase
MSASSRSPLRGRYLVRDPLGNAWLRMYDAVLRATNASSPGPRGVPQRLLIAVGGHLGDAVLATSVFAPLRAALPGVELGVLTGRWNRPVFEGHHAVARVHVADHWRLDRGDGSLARRWLQARASARRARGEIAAIGYDAAIDLYPYYPNSAALLKRAGIPVRIGYSSGGGGPLFTNAVPFTAGAHVADDHRALLRVFVATFDGAPRCDVGAVSAANAESARAILHRAGVAGDHVVMHMGAGSSRKEWPAERWASLAAQLRATGSAVVLTGAGRRQRAACAALAARVDGMVNLCDQLSWGEYHAVIATARLVLSVDTVAAHLAAACDVPYVAVATGIDEPERWRPIGRGALLSAPVACAPCYRSDGCSAMSCVRDVSVEQVLSAARALLGERPALSAV